MVRRGRYSGISGRIFEAAADMVGERQVQAELAGRLKLPRSAVSSRLRGETSWKAEDIEAVAEWLGIPVGAFYGNLMRVPVMGSVAANPRPGLVREASDEPEEYLEIPQKLMAFNVYDTSMVPLARPGQKILVSPAAPVVSGDLVVANVLDGESEGAWLFKRYERQKVGKGWKVLLQCIAPGYPTLVLSEQSVRLWRVVGLWLLTSPRWPG
ncbi:MAG: LexA family transcriptional regulator, partial [Planctomycetes bacterium]|nr:LexA family transcriptional regulator [Planctomycetota bacterium]